jgi:hypothetical protein
VIHRILITASWVCCAIVIASFALFVRDQLATGSQHQANEVSASVTPTRAPSPHQVGQPKRFIDGAAHALTSPFASIVSSDSDWVNQGLPTLFALIVYGGGLGFAARFTRGMA